MLLYRLSLDCSVFPEYRQMPFYLNSILKRKAVHNKIIVDPPKTEEPYVPVKLEITIPSYTLEDDNDIELRAPSIKRTITTRKVPLNPLSDS